MSVCMILVPMIADMRATMIVAEEEASTIGVIDTTDTMTGIGTMSVWTEGEYVYLGLFTSTKSCLFIGTMIEIDTTVIVMDMIGDMMIGGTDFGAFFNRLAFSKQPRSSELIVSSSRIYIFYLLLSATST